MDGSVNTKSMGYVVMLTTIITVGITLQPLLTQNLPLYDVSAWCTVWMTLKKMAATLKVHK